MATVTEIAQLPDPPALARRAAERVLEIARGALEARGAFHVALAGGHTPRLLYEELARRPEGSDFERWQVFFGDERCVPPDHPDSNYRTAHEAWLGHGRVPARQIHRLRGELEPAVAAEEYERELGETFATREVPSFDLILLGLGRDGHTASLFPGSSALEEARRWVTSTWVESLAAHRLTLTLRTINATRCALFLVAGADKAEVLRDVLHGSGNPRALPARLVRPWDGSLTWLVDGAAASRLVDG